MFDLLKSQCPLIAYLSSQLLQAVAKYQHENIDNAASIKKVECANKKALIGKYHLGRKLLRRLIFQDRYNLDKSIVKGLHLLAYQQLLCTFLSCRKDSINSEDLTLIVSSTNTNLMQFIEKVSLNDNYFWLSSGYSQIIMEILSSVPQQDHFLRETVQVIYQLQLIISSVDNRIHVKILAMLLYNNKGMFT